MRLGVNSFLFTSPFTTAAGRIFAKVAAMGFQAFEMAMEEPDLVNPDEARIHLAENGLQPAVCVVVGPDRNLADGDGEVSRRAEEYLRFCLEFAAKVGAKVVCGPFHSAVGFAELLTEKERARVMERLVPRLRALAALADGSGIRLAIEPLNRFENCLINTVGQAMELIEMVGSRALGIHLDTFHMNIEEKNLEEAILRAGPSLYHFHACENDRGIPGTGHIPWPGVARALRKVGYSGDVVIESFTDRVRSIARSVSIWRRLAPSPEALAKEGLRYLKRTLFP